MEIENKAQVKTGDKFGLIGWWVNKNLTDSPNLIYVADPEDGVPGPDRVIFVYFGKNKPTTDEMRNLITSTVFRW
ncbi:Uncharacterised protein [Legionella donaldsonii]|uniref:Uncharacterized protein n=1 Tax=Legionella donaldsonii TaxID=45060 RepID=A0A378J854_9GAMM|nr:hypothetical protein [Legionella donaldsonii]STX43963.1 Uncharacterised protein [Legionella donaldsonii]